MRIVCALVALAGCYDPTFKVGLPCSPDGKCPRGQECAPDGTCQLLGGAEIDGGSSSDDAGAPDAMPVAVEPWLVSFHHPNIFRASDVAQVGGGFAVVGSSTVIVLDPLGQVRWQRTLDGVSARAVAGAPGGLVVAGNEGSAMSAAALDHQGDLRWQKTYTDQESNEATAVVAMPGSEDVVLIGNSSDGANLSSPWLVRVDGSGEIVWQRRFTLALDVRVSGGTATGDGGVVAIGVRDGATLEDRDLIVFKVDQAGDLEWQKVVIGGDNEWGESVAEEVDGTLVLVGGTWAGSFGLADLWLLRMSQSGSLQEQHRIGTTAQDTGRRVFTDVPGGVLLIGETREAGNDDMLVVQIKNNAFTTQLRVGSGVNEYGAGGAYGYGNDGLVVFGDTDAFDDHIGFFAAGLVLPDGLDEGCEYGALAGMDMATSSATASSVDFTVTTTTATADDLDAAVTTSDLTTTAECE